LAHTSLLGRKRGPHRAQSQRLRPNARLREPTTGLPNPVRVRQRRGNTLLTESGLPLAGAESKAAGCFASGQSSSVETRHPSAIPREAGRNL
jgi:hypothetical protein